jgi:adenylate cyclase class 2
MPWEVEQKFLVQDITATEAKLAQLGAIISVPIEQVDWYFNHPSRDFGQTDEALRLRQVGRLNWITYKGPRIDTTTKTRQELELPLPDGPGIPGQFAILLTALGFQPAATVRKTRRPGKLNWEGRRIEVALDSVDHVGTYLELEIIAQFDEVNAARTVLQALSERLSLGATERRSYLELLLNGIT